MNNQPLFSQLFSRSPLQPVQHHMGKCHECTEALVPFFEAVHNGQWDSAQEQYDHIASLENEADSLKKEIRLNLPRALFLPVSRDDLLEMIHVQDKIANSAKDIAGLILGRTMQFPIDTHPLLADLLIESIKATELATTAAQEISNLVRTGFSNQNVNLIESTVDKLSEVEHSSDLIQIKLRRVIFKIEDNLKPIDVMFMYRIIDLIGDLSDCAQTTGNRMMCLIAR